MTAALLEVGLTVVPQIADVKGSDSSIFITEVVLLIAEMTDMSKNQCFIVLDN